MSLFETSQYLQDKYFAGTKYAGLKLLQSLEGIDTIPQIFSSGFKSYEQLLATGFGDWLSEAYVHRNTIMHAYESALLGNNYDLEMMVQAFAFFETHFFLERELRLPFKEKIKPYIAEQKELIDQLFSLVDKNKSYLLRSSADIEDEETNTAGLFVTRVMTSGLTKKEHIIDELSSFYSQNILKSVLHNRSAKIAFVLCEYIPSTAGGIGLSYDMDHYFEISRSVMDICMYGQNNLNMIQGTADNFAFTSVGKRVGEVHYTINGVDSYITEQQLTALFADSSQLEKMIGRVNTEYLFKHGNIHPTFLQVRKFNPKVGVQLISNQEYDAAQYKTQVALKPGAVQVPIFALPYAIDLVGEFHLINVQKTIENLQQIDQQNPYGYALVDGLDMCTIDFPIQLGDKYFVGEKIIDAVRRLCSNVKVFINNSEISSKGNHGQLNMASDDSNQFYLSIPHFKIDDGSIAEIRSDGWRGIVNLK